MEVRKGYKQTEVGVIPKDWEVKPIKNVATVVRGASPRPAGSPKYFNGNFIPWLTVAALTNIPANQIYVSETASYLTEEGSRYSRILEKDTLIISNSGATLGVAKILGIRCCANDGVAAFLDVNKEEVDNLFLCYYLNTQTNYFREIIARGNGQPNLNTTLIGDVNIITPPLLEQQAIAAALSDMDSLLTALDSLIAKKRLIKQGAMQELLTGKRRLSGFRDKWKSRTIDEMFQFLSTANNSRSELATSGTINYIHYGDIHTTESLIDN